MYILNIARAIKMMSVNEIFENHYKLVGFSKVNSYYSAKLWKKRIFVAWEQIHRKNT